MLFDFTARIYGWCELNVYMAHTYGCGFDTHTYTCRTKKAFLAMLFDFTAGVN
jgi:hypothetical protein